MPRREEEVEYGSICGIKSVNGYVDKVIRMNDARGASGISGIWYRTRTWVGVISNWDVPSSCWALQAWETLQM